MQLEIGKIYQIEFNNKIYNELMIYDIYEDVDDDIVYQCYDKILHRFFNISKKSVISFRDITEVKEYDFLNKNNNYAFTREVTEKEKTVLEKDGFIANEHK